MPTNYATLTDFGAVGDGITDDTAAVQAAFDAHRSGGDLSGGFGKVYRLTSTIQIRDTQCLNFFGEGRTQEVDNICFRWDGPPGWWVFMLDGVRDSRFASFCIRAGANRPGIGINYDYFRSPAPGMTVPTACRFEYIQIRNADRGIVFMEQYKGNGELMVLDHVAVINDVLMGHTTGIEILSPNAMGNKIIGGQANHCGRGVVVDGGNYSSWGLNFQENLTDLDLRSTAGPILMEATQQENSRCFLSASPGVATVHIKGLRSAIAEGLPTGQDGTGGRFILWMPAGNLTLEDCEFQAGQGGHHPDWHVQLGKWEWPRTNARILGCRFPNGNPIEYSQGPWPYPNPREQGNVRIKVENCIYLPGAGQAYEMLPDLDFAGW